MNGAPSLSIMGIDDYIKLNAAFLDGRNYSRKELKRKIEAMEHRYDEQFRIVFEAITQLIEEDEKPKKKIGYIKEGQTQYGERSRKN